MALTKCKECSGTLAKSARACPHCGAKHTPPVGVVGLLFFGLIFLIVFRCSSGPDFGEKWAEMTPGQQEAALEEQREKDAKYACKEGVQRTLKSSSTAKFPNYQDFFAKKLAEGTYEITGFVEAQNSFGAMIRTNFICDVVRNSDTAHPGGTTWTATSVRAQ